MKARYNRISTQNQNLERQLAKQHPEELLYNDVVSGTTPFAKREKGSELSEAILNGKISYLSVSSIDRLGRNLHDIMCTIEFLKINAVTLKVDNLGIESMIEGKKNPTFDLIVSVMANVAVMERETLLERQREGIAEAKKKGVYKGRQRGSKDSNETVLIKYKGVVKLLKENMSLRRIAKLEDVSLGTVQKVKAIVSN
jgi:DNA invertase Pin-like site-specific DNA recombinase